MPDYRIFNPDNADGVGPSTYVTELPAALQQHIADELRKATSWPSGADRGAELRLSDLSDVIDVTAALDRWASAEGVDPARATVQEAAWLYAGADGQQALSLVRIEQDPLSPTGRCWRPYSFTWEQPEGAPGKWEGTRHNPIWSGITSASQFEGYARPSGFWPEEARVVRVPPEFAADSLNVWNDPAKGEPRLAVDAPGTVADEVAAMGYIDWAARDKPPFPNLFGRIAAGDDDIAAIAGPFDVRVAYNPETRTATAYAQAPGAFAVAGARAADSSPAEVAAAKERAYAELHQKASSDFAGVVNPADPKHPHATLAEARDARLAALAGNRPAPSRAEVPKAKAATARPVVGEDAARTSCAPRRAQALSPDMLPDHVRAASI